MNEWIIIAIVGVVLLFSAKKLPDMARGLGQSMRIFKAETRGMREDEQAGSRPAGEVGPGHAAGDGTSSENGGPSSTATGRTSGSDGVPRAGS